MTSITDGSFLENTSEYKDIETLLRYSHYTPAGSHTGSSKVRTPRKSYLSQNLDKNINLIDHFKAYEEPNRNKQLKKIKTISKLISSISEKSEEDEYKIFINRGSNYSDVDNYEYTDSLNIEIHDIKDFELLCNKKYVRPKQNKYHFIYGSHLDIVFNYYLLGIKK